MSDGAFGVRRRLSVFELMLVLAFEMVHVLAFAIVLALAVRI